jgi:redox-sensitive bicupin YhaK (pirin superfamily)
MHPSAARIQPDGVQGARRIVARTRGRERGPVVRLMSPSDLGELVKPFVFLDLIDTQGFSKPRAEDFGLHPHSGIATLTWLFEGEVDYEDTTGRRGRISAGHMEWMHAGGGAWHGGDFGENASRVRGLQLWIALPPEAENGPAESHYVAPARAQQSGPATVLLGDHGLARGAIAPPSPINYLSIRLRAGERWRYSPCAGHTVAWVAVSKGLVRVPDEIRAGEMVVFEESLRGIEFDAAVDAEFVLGTAVKHPHDLVLGNFSVHTSVAALREGEGRIARIGRTLRSAGRWV